MSLSQKINGRGRSASGIEALLEGSKEYRIICARLPGLQFPSPYSWSIDRHHFSHHHQKYCSDLLLHWRQIGARSRIYNDLALRQAFLSEERRWVAPTRAPAGCGESAGVGYTIFKSRPLFPLRIAHSRAPQSSAVIILFTAESDCGGTSCF